MSVKKNIVIVSPALSGANNGNWQTAHRWQRMLSTMYRTRVSNEWPDAMAGDDAALIALHARRSAASIGKWHEVYGSRGLALALTGTDLYGDIHQSADAQRSLLIAQKLVVLQEHGVQDLPEKYRHKSRVIFQSAPSRAPLAKTVRHLRIVMAGHLREEKSPQTLFDAARLLKPDDRILIDHIGGALTPALGKAARDTAAACPHYRWLGSLSHATTRGHIQRAHVLVHASRLEGGAHVIMEAICSGTPVLASRVAGNVGMLGQNYAGYFAHGDAGALAALLLKCRDEIISGTTSRGALLTRLQAQCERRRALFDPLREQRALLKLAAELLS